MKKEVVLTPENYPEMPLIRVNEEEIEFLTGSNPSNLPIRTKE